MKALVIIDFRKIFLLLIERRQYGFIFVVLNNLLNYKFKKSQFPF